METNEASKGGSTVSHLRPGWVDTLVRQASRVRFGTIEITIVDGKVVQLETSERVRFTSAKSDQATGGK
jgi:hypothetical protein